MTREEAVIEQECEQRIEAAGTSELSTHLHTLILGFISVLSTR